MSDTPDFAGLPPDDALRSVIARIATGPTQSKSISREEARVAMGHVLAGRAEEVHAALFLIGLRMKRETDDEYLGLVDALTEALVPATVDVARLLDIADPFDGFERSLPAAPFLPAVLAACGLPAMSRGLASVSPKFGVTHRQVLAAAGLPVDASPQLAAACIADPEIGWAYLDQSSYSPALHGLVALRALLVKRPAVTTVERIVGPLRAAAGPTHLALGYVHKAYPRIYGFLAGHAGYASALLVRGVEGGLVPSLRQPARVLDATAGAEPRETTIDPTSLGITSALRAPQPTDDGGALASQAATAGLAALDGAPGATRDALVLGAALGLWHAGLAETPRAGADHAREVIDSGAAAARLLAARRRRDAPGAGPAPA